MNNNLDEFIKAYVPYAYVLTYEEELALAKQRDEEAANQLEQDFIDFINGTH